MSRRAVALTGKHDQIVMFTLVELMTHLIFLALILGFALRKEADPVYRQLTAKCGTDGSQCVAVQKPIDKGTRPGGQGRPNCLGKGEKLFSLRARGDGSFALRPSPGLSVTVRSNPAVARLLKEATLTRGELGLLGGAAKKAANSGNLSGQSCEIAIDLCRAHPNYPRFEGQYNFARQFFNVPGPHACRG